MSGLSIYSNMTPYIHSRKVIKGFGTHTISAEEETCTEKLNVSINYFTCCFINKKTRMIVRVFLVLLAKTNPESFLVRNHWKEVLRCVHCLLHNFYLLQM